MPFIWTHIQFSEDVIDAIEGSSLFSQLESYMKLGAQGANLFFYQCFYTERKENPAYQMNQRILKTYPDILLNMIKTAKFMNKQAHAYTFGFITHYILESYIQPYILYFANYFDYGREEFKAIIDTCIMGKYYNLNTWKVPVYKEINVGLALDEDIIKLLYTMINRHFPKIHIRSINYIQRSYWKMRLLLKLLFDPHGWKCKLFRSYFPIYSSHTFKENHPDYLNLNHATWIDVATNKQTEKSFINLYDEAHAQAIEIMNKVFNYWYEKDKNKQLNLHDIFASYSFAERSVLKISVN